MLPVGTEAKVESMSFHPELEWASESSTQEWMVMRYDRNRAMNSTDKIMIEAGLAVEPRAEASI
jgi:hypothetical protein